MRFPDAKMNAGKHPIEETVEQTQSQVNPTRKETRGEQTATARAQETVGVEPGMAEQVTGRTKQMTEDIREGISGTVHQTAESARHARDQVMQTVKDAASYVTGTRQPGVANVGEGLTATYDSARQKVSDMGGYINQKTADAASTVRDTANDARESSRQAAHDTGDAIGEHYEKGKEKVTHGVEYVQNRAEDAAQAASNRIGADCWVCARWCRVCGITLDFNPAQR